jgi:hypothetical protein
MKQNLNLRLPMLLFLLSGCASGGVKFIGQWQPVQSAGFSGRNILVIEKKGKVYDSYTIAAPDKLIRFGYDKEHDYLTGKHGTDTFNIIYLDSTGNIRLIAVKASGYHLPVIEYQKADVLQ